ncbi:MAG: S8 family serine peptidase [Gammaproteobacteria bacterium]|jgi:serine protease|nr:S8 family serine peptidase [Gammaproteobacteria bacterium]
MKIWRQFFFGVIFVLAATQGGCGGGGGGGTPPPPPEKTYAISGTISAAAYTAMDSDVNDPAAPYAPNDDFDQAQPVGNPVAIGGYVNQPGNGPFGRSSRIGDVSDFYKVTLAANQTITLSIGEADLQSNDIDIFLYDEGRGDEDSSQGSAKTKSITVKKPGTYYIEVAICTDCPAGASNYTLTIGFNFATASTMAGTLRLGDDFVPGDIVVQFKDDNRSLNSASAASRAQTLGLTAKAGDVGRPMLLSLGDAQQRSRMRSALGIAATEDAATSSQLKRETIQAIKALRRRADVAYAEPNYIRTATAIPNDESYPRQWHYPLINLPQAWDITSNIPAGSKQVIVAVIDTGVLPDHPDLQGQFVPGYDFIKDPTSALDGDGIDSNADDPGDQGPTGSSFHGTHVAGTIAATTNNTSGVAGVAWGAKVMPLRALGKLGGASYDILQAVRYAAGLINDSGRVPDKPADIINLSLGGSGYSQAEQDVFSQARKQNMIIVAAAGNEASSTAFYPASYAGVISVSAVDAAKNLAYYSNYGANIDVAAPGGDSRKDINGDGFPDGILSTRGDDTERRKDSTAPIQYTYSFLQGTSMATPHVAGVIALMKAVNSKLTPDWVDTQLINGKLTQDIGDSGRDDKYGHGLIDASKAVVAAQEAAPTPTLITSPSMLNFGLTSTEIDLAVGSIGGAVTVYAPTGDATWLSVTEKSVDSSTKLGVYTVKVDRSSLAVGAYSATLTFTSSANTVALRVTLQVGTPGAATSPDAGYHYVLLIDPATGEVMKQATVGVDASGQYRYSVTGVAAGTYQVIAGSDSNNNQIICDPGEACGSYLTLEQPKLVTITDSGLGGIDFTTGFDTSLRANLSVRTQQSGLRRITKVKGRTWQR